MVSLRWLRVVGLTYSAIGLSVYLYVAPEGVDSIVWAAGLLLPFFTLAALYDSAARRSASRKTGGSYGGDRGRLPDHFWWGWSTGFFTIMLPPLGLALSVLALVRGPSAIRSWARVTLAISAVSTTFVLLVFVTE